MRGGACEIPLTLINALGFEPGNVNPCRAALTFRPSVEVWVPSPLGSFIRLMNAPLRLAGDTLMIRRLPGYVPGAVLDHQ